MSGKASTLSPINGFKSFHAFSLKTGTPKASAKLQTSPSLPSLSLRATDMGFHEAPNGCAVKPRKAC
jgi:hypothetical protein